MRGGPGAAGRVHGSSSVESRKGCRWLNGSVRVAWLKGVGGG